ncbi:MAG: rubrerythrin [Syntrophomonadaceae bacterium]|jgi:rubrerythrin|nr:rubrerythrin [Syntrophomonadaceae bacterium]
MVEFINMNHAREEGDKMSIIEAMKLAIEEEARAARRYRELAEMAEDNETRLLFEQLALEEDAHYKKLSERLKALKLMGD